MNWIYIVQDDGKDGAYLASFQDERQAQEYAEHIGAANVHKVLYFGDAFVMPTFQPKREGA